MVGHRPIVHTFEPGARVRHLQTVSYAMAALGIVLTVAALAADLSAAVMLSGLLLVVAGLVKIVMIALWNGIAGMAAAPETEPVARPVPARRSRRGRAPEGDSR